MNSDSFDCANCIYGRHCDESNPAPFPKWAIKSNVKFGGEKLNMELLTCPLKIITQESYELLNLYPHYRDGRMPLAGGLLDQPNSFLLAMEILGAHMATRDNGKATRK